MDRRLRTVVRSLSLCTLAVAPSAALAHAGESTRSSLSAAIVIVLMLTALMLYLRGLAALWRSAGPGRGVMRRNAWAFFAGWLVLAASLFGPIETWSRELFVAHMVQHELVMLAAAPLLVLGTPLATWSWGLPASWGARTGNITRAIGRSRIWRALTDPLGAWLLHAIAIWAWHVPALFSAALDNELVHDLQHGSFLGTALLFWWTLLRPRASRRADGIAVLLLFTTMLHTGALGALLTFSHAPWYARYEGDAGLTALEDQQLGGLVMWLPGGAVYAIAALALVARFLAEPRGAGREVVR